VLDLCLLENVYQCFGVDLFDGWIGTVRARDCILLKDCCAGIVTQSDAKTSICYMRACERNTYPFVCV
jgi:hypothetical protein